MYCWKKVNFARHLCVLCKVVILASDILLKSLHGRFFCPFLRKFVIFFFVFRRPRQKSIRSRRKLKRSFLPTSPFFANFFKKSFKIGQETCLEQKFNKRALKTFWIFPRIKQGKKSESFFWCNDSFFFFLGPVPVPCYNKNRDSKAEDFFFFLIRP